MVRYPLLHQIESGLIYSSVSGIGVAAWQKLGSGFHRCRSICLPVITFDLPELQDLSFPQIEDIYEKHYYKVNWFWEAMMESPKLTTFSAYDFSLSLPVTRLKVLELRHLTPFHGDPFCPYDISFLIVLSASQNLETLKLTTLYDVTNMDPVVQEIEISLPRNLILLGNKNCGKEFTFLVSFLLSLSLPSLDSLALTCRGWPESVLTLVSWHHPIAHEALRVHSEGAGENGTISGDTFTPLLRSQSFRSFTHLELAAMRMMDVPLEMLSFPMCYPILALSLIPSLSFRNLNLFRYVSSLSQ